VKGETKLRISARHDKICIHMYIYVCVYLFIDLYLYVYIYSVLLLPVGALPTSRNFCRGGSARAPSPCSARQGAPYICIHIHIHIHIYIPIELGHSLFFFSQVRYLPVEIQVVAGQRDLRLSARHDKAHHIYVYIYVYICIYTYL